MRRLAAPLFVLGVAVVKLDVAKGTALLPLSQSKQCYLPGHSKPVRT